jgi:hypothetical protein
MPRNRSTAASTRGASSSPIADVRLRRVGRVLLGTSPPPPGLPFPTLLPWDMPSTVCQWMRHLLHRRHRPFLSTFLEICYILEICPVKFVRCNFYDKPVIKRGTVWENVIERGTILETVICIGTFSYFIKRGKGYTFYKKIIILYTSSLPSGSVGSDGSVFFRENRRSCHYESTVT